MRERNYPELIKKLLAVANAPSATANERMIARQQAIALQLKYASFLPDREKCPGCPGCPHPNELPGARYGPRQYYRLK